MFIHEGAVQKVVFKNANASQSELPQEYSERYGSYGHYDAIRDQ